MDSYDKFYNATFGWNRRLLAAMGFDIYDKDFKLTLHTYITQSLVLILLGIIIYTAIFYDNFTRVNCVFYLSLALQAGFKMYNVRYNLDFLRMITFIENLFKLHIKTKSRARLMLFQRFAFYTDIIVKFGFVMYFGSAFLCLPYPLFIYYYENRRIPLVLFYIPGIDENTITGYYILVCIQFAIMVIAAVGMCAVDVFYAVILSNVPIAARLIEDEVNQLNHSLDENPKDTRTWKHQFRNILSMHLEMSTYLSDLNLIFFKICFVQVVTCMWIVVALSYVVMTTYYVPAIIFGLAASVSLFIFCTFGHIVAETNSVAERAANDVDYYLLGLKEQKMYVQFLMNTQHPCYLTIGGLSYLNWPTCVQLFKSIYYWINILHSMQ